MNVVFRTDLRPDRADELVDEALTHFSARQIAELSWWTRAWLLASSLSAVA